MNAPFPISAWDEGFKPGRLWSWWDMLRVNTEHTMAAFGFLGGTVKFLQLARTRCFEANGAAMAIDQDNYTQMLAAIDRLGKAAVELDLPASKAAATRAHDTSVAQYSPRFGYDVNRLSALIDSLIPLVNVFIDELKARIVVSLSTRHSHLYSSTKPLFGDEVETAFPHAIEDVAEAGKCLTVEQPTAVVFHLMRAMEIAVQALSSKLGIGDCNKEWGKLLSDMTQKVEAMPKGDLRDQWSGARTHLYHVKQAWRNGTMHPKQTYTMEEAGAIFDAVRVFMRELAALV